jgi:hypothetical protein
MMGTSYTEMRYFSALSVAALIVAPPLAAPGEGQNAAAYVIPSVPAPRDPLPRFTIAPRGAPLGPVGLPLPRIGVPPQAPVPVDQPGHVGPAFYPWPMMVFYVPQPSAAAVAAESDRRPVVSNSSAAAERPVLPGRLVLDIVPASAQVFADGYYVGVPADFSLERGGGVLDAGTHHLDLNAPGYEPVAVDIRVASGQVVTYRATLKALPPPMPAPPSTFYLIPGCYMGNIPPKDARLPDSCDKNRAIVWRP